MLLAGVAPGEEVPFAPPGRRARIADAQQVAHLCGQPVPPGQFLLAGDEQVSLRLEPGGSFGARVVLQPPVGVTDLMPQDVFGQVEPARRRISVLSHAGTLRSRSPCTLMRWRMRVPGDTLG